MYGYIYKITVNNPNNKLNGCYYIGQHKYNTHTQSYWGSGIIITDYRKVYGTKYLKKEILCECKSLEELNQKEAEYIGNLFLTDAYFEGGKCLNLMSGGLTGRISKETKRKHSLAHKGHKHSEETKRKLSEMKKGKPCLKLRGRHLPEEHRKKIAESNRGKKASPEVRKKISLAKIGFKHTEEAKKKIGEAGKGRKHSEETRKKISEKTKNRHWWNNGKEQKSCEKCPGEGWIQGILYRKPYELKPYNNGKITVYRKKCPKGFVRGELKNVT